MELINFVDYFGTFVFAISGVIAGVEKKFDFFGVMTLAIVTAIGGGTLRDLLIGSTPVGWMQDEKYIYIILLAIPICYFFIKRVQRLKKGLFLFDTIGIGLFTILGIQKTLDSGLSPTIAVVMGVVSAVFGGIIRDVLSNEVPLIFRKEIYASACFIGAIVFMVAKEFLLEPFGMVLSIFVVIMIRIMAIKLKWELPFNPIDSK